MSCSITGTRGFATRPQRPHRRGDGKSPSGICGIFPPRLRGFPPDGPQARPSNIALVPPRVWRLAGQRSVGIPRRGTEATRRREAL